MKSVLSCGNLAAIQIMIGHGTGADALLRCLERSTAWGAILITPCDEYHAGERHGRPYHWTDIRQNCSHFLEHLYSTDDGFVSASESAFVARNLGVDAKVLNDRGRFTDKVSEASPTALRNGLNYLLK